MKQRTKRLTFLLSAALLVSLLTWTASAIDVNTGVYSPVWSKRWVPAGAEGMWKGYYILHSENTLKTDLIEKGGGEWGVPGAQYAVIWEGLNIVAPCDEADVGYLFNALEGGKVEFTVTGKLDQPTATDVEISVFKNSFGTMVYPESGKPVVATVGKDVSMNFVLDLKKGDKVFFNFHSPVEIADTPQFRFSQFQAVWRSLDTGAAPVDSAAPSQKPGSSAQPSPSSATAPGTQAPASSQATGTPAESTTPSEPGTPTGGEIVIDDDDSFYLSPKYDDVKIDEEKSVITLSKRLTLADFKDSFHVKSGYTFRVFNKDTTEVTDNATVITEDMIVRIYNHGTPINVMTIETAYQETAGPAEPKFPLIPVVIGSVAVLAVAAVAIVFVTKKNKPAAQTAESSNGESEEGGNQE